MNDFPNRTQDDGKSSSQPILRSPLTKRMIAFAMDFILLVLLQLLAHFMPKFWDIHTQKNFSPCPLHSFTSGRTDGL